jgi:RNA polymerase sigma-70 factor (ECF subfamily)
MEQSAAKPKAPFAGRGRFPTTHWTVVLAASQGPSPQADQALAALCERYWYPLYAYVRRRGYSHEDAQDLTQEFFARLIDRNFLHRFNLLQGRFRSFLLGAMNHLLSDARDRARRRKRGGGLAPVPLDDQTAQSRYRGEPVDRLDAEKIFERRWALDLLARVLDRLESDYAASGKARQFAELQGFLVGEPSAVPYRQVAARLGVSQGAVKAAVHRMRRRFGELFRAEVARTVSTAAEVQDEINHLLAVLSAAP